MAHDLAFEQIKVSFFHFAFSFIVRVKSLKNSKMSYDLYGEQGKWRNWEGIMDVVLSTTGLKKEDLLNQHAIDIGCGIGSSTKVLAQNFGSVVGIDGDASLIARARTDSDAKNISYEQFPDLVTFDAYGRRFDFLFSAYTIAYLGNISSVLRKWATLLKPGGVMVVMDVQGLFSVHQPLESKSRWFTRFDYHFLKEFGYNCAAGSELESSVSNIAELRKVACLDWKDPELAFDGPLEMNSSIWNAWQERWRRLWPLMNQAEVEDGLYDEFFKCLLHPQHSCNRPVKMLITSRNFSPQIQSAELPIEDEDDNFVPSSAGNVE